MIITPVSYSSVVDNRTPKQQKKALRLSTREKLRLRRSIYQSAKRRAAILKQINPSITNATR